MPVNIEIKVKCHDFSEIIARIQRSAGAVRVELDQEDIFFNVPRGKLKMRCDKKGKCELIYYRRKALDGIMTSSYFRQPMDNPEIEYKKLIEQYGATFTVRKHRIAFIAGDVRIHLDDVECLGRFLEVEVLTDSVAGRNSAKQVAKQLIKVLGLTHEDLITDAYEDLLVSQALQCRRRELGCASDYDTAHLLGKIL